MTSPAGVVARVRLIDDDRDVMHIEFPNGSVAATSGEDLGDESADYFIGEVLLLDNQGLVVERDAPRRLWPRIDSGAIARVKLIDDDRDVLHIEFPNGTVTPTPSKALGDESGAYFIGEVILLDIQGQIVERDAPRKLWPRGDSVGTVKHVGDEQTLVLFGSTLRQVPTTRSIDYTENCTVEADDFWGVTALISTTPITIFDREDDEDSAASYIVSPDLEESYDTFGGSRELVNRARSLIETPLKFGAVLREIGAKPTKGVLFTGPPGTGKTKLARIIAAHTGSTFYAVSGPQVFSKWYGSSEKIIRRLFAHAADEESAVIFFDEIDSVAGQRGDDSHEASKRVVTQLLTSMDGLKKDSNVMVIATTNRPDDIDRALRRPGRFDTELEFPLPGPSDRLLILQASGAAVARRGQMPVEYIVSQTHGWTPAELAAIWTEAALCAVVDGRREVWSEDLLRGHRRVLETRRAKAKGMLP